MSESGASTCSGGCGGKTSSRSPAELDLAPVEAIVASIGRRPEDLIPLLQAMQKHYNYLPKPALERLCQITDITPDVVDGVSTFYSQFRHHPVGKHVIRTCTGTACHVSGANILHDTFRQHLKIKPGEHTDGEGEFTVEEVACLGCCMLAPVAQIDDVIYGQIETWKVPDLIEDFRASEKTRVSADANGGKLSARDTVGEVRICLCSSCVAGGSRKVYDEVMRQSEKLDIPVKVKDVGCTGISYDIPLVEFHLYNDNRYRYGKVDPVDVRDLLLRHFRPISWWKRAGARLFHTLETFFTDESWVPPTRYSQDVRHGVEKAYTGAQVRLVTEHAGTLDPRSIDDYIQHDGFKALESVLKQRKFEDVIAEVKSSGLRGRGGAGFPTGMKWEMTRATPNDVKYVICNGDEGDPGAFMDRMILESFPYRVLEGMVIAAFAVGAHDGFLYIRAEYPLATKRIREAIRVCEERGLLGENIMGTGFKLKLKVVEGAGAFVCGEETALMSAIEGGRGMPRFRPPFPAQSGLWGKPTCINNVETFASIPWIIRNGAKAFAAYGTEKSKGTKTFALAGKVRRGGLIEVPMGMTINEIVNDIGGGVPEGRKLKAVLMGGPSGGCVPAHLAHTPVDYEALKSVGAIIGSGGMVVLDDTDCIVDIARYFLSFTQDESCGKCTHCRIGTKRMKEVLDRLCCGKGRKGDLELLETLSTITIEGSLCGLGKTAPNPVLSSLRYYRAEYEAHVQGKCPARRCKNLVQYFITDTCFGCTRCSQMCPTDSIPMNPYHHHVIEESTCTRCDICLQVCPVNAIEKIPM